MTKLTKLVPATFMFMMLGGLSACTTGSKKEPELREIPPLVVETGASSQPSCGNEPSYTLNGRTYEVLPSAEGYREQGLASWYGAEYQGSETAGCETFDMYAFTAAHRSLPLPSFVRVTHQQNGKSVLVRVNDRGPFDQEGLIQLSFAAANALGMTQRGKVARVTVETINPELAQSALQQTTKASPASPRFAKPTPSQAKAIQIAKQSGKSFFIVVNNYQDQADALDMFVRLTSVGLSKTELASAQQDGRVLHQVRIGPLYTQDQIDNVKDLLESNGLATFKVVEVDQ